MAGNKKQKYAVEAHGVDDKVLKLYKEGVSAIKISKKLLEEDGLKISHIAIGRYLKKFKTIDSSKQNLAEMKKFEAVVIDYKMELTSILEEVKQVKDQALADGNLPIYEKLVGRLYQGIQLIGEFMGDIKQRQQIDINIVLDEISKRTFLENKESRNAFKRPIIIDVETEVELEDELEAQKIRGIVADNK